MKKIITILLVIFIFLLAGCENNKVESGESIEINNDLSLEETKITSSGDNISKTATTTSLYTFKSEYESKNDKTSKDGSNYRILSIPEDNPYEKITLTDLIDMVENKDTFYLFVGDSLCPWCRSVLEKSIEVASNNGIDKIYYLKIWDENGDELFRDKYKLEDGKLILEVEGKEEYFKILKVFDTLLDDYEFSPVSGDKIKVGEKRLYAPSYIYIENGVAKKLIDGISELQTDSKMELTDEILKEQEEIFKEFFG